MIFSTPITLRVRYGLLVAALIWLPACDSKREKLPKLEISRPIERIEHPFIGEIERAKNWQELDDTWQPFLVRYSVPAVLADYPLLSPNAGPVDPFAPDSTRRTTTRDQSRNLTAVQDMLKQAGIEFAGSTWAIYDSRQETLTVYNTAKQQELVATFIDSFKYDPVRALHFHFDVYEVSADDAQIILDIADDAMRLIKVQEWLVTDRSRFATSASISTQSGQRSKSRSVTSTHHGGGDSLKAVGLTTEFDAVVGADNETIELLFQLSTTQQFGESRSEVRTDDLFQLPPSGSITAQTELKTTVSQLLGVLAPPGDIATSDTEPSLPDGNVWLPFVTSSNPHTVYPALPETNHTSDPIGDPFSLRTRIYEISQIQWQVLGTYLLGAGHQAHLFSIPGLAAHQKNAPTLKSVFEPFGFNFGKGSRLVYDAETEELIASLNAFNMARLESMIGSFEQEQNSVGNINLEIDVFQLPARLCIELGKSASRGADHSPEWRAVQRLVESGDAQAISLLVGQASSGKRGKIQNSDERIFIADYRKKEDEDHLSPNFEEMRLGTSLEFDVQTTDSHGSTLSLSLVFNHQTGPPGKANRSIHFLSTGEIADFEAATFSSHQTNCQFSMRSGTRRILGMWRGDTEKSDLMQIAFLRAQADNSFNIKRIH